MTQTVVRSGIPYVPPSRTTRGTVLDYAHIIEGVGMIAPDGMVWSYNCIGIDVDPVDCATFTGLSKRFDAPSSSDGAMFVIQGGLTCKPFGFDMNDPALRSAFNAVEGEGVSIGLREAIFDTQAVDITPTAGSVSPVVALGLLEGYGYSYYAGNPIIHLGPSMVSQLAAVNSLVISNGQVHTALGTPVAVSAGNETKTAGKLDQDQWAYVTGAVVLSRSEVELHSELNTNTNDGVVLYERLYVAGVDCLIGKVKVKVY